ncbi:MAG: alkaline phosphatase D family protein [Deltaproteobacteria bacterium]|nr:alkaline phosphatase D family protein [Deltaproteobacteria bacterium]
MLAASGAVAACESETAAPAASAPKVCSPVGGGATITHGPISGGGSASSIRLAVRLSGAGKVAFDVTASGGKTVRSTCAVSSETDDFSVVIDVSGLAAATEYSVVPVIDDVAAPARTIQTRTYAKAGQVTDFTFTFGSCCRYDDKGVGTKSMGKVFDVARKLQPKPWFFAQIGDWTYPDYAFSTKGTDQAGNNYTAYPEEIAKSWRRRLVDGYPLRDLLATMPIAHVWDDHDFAENNAWGGVTGKQSDRMAAFERYLPCHALPKSKAGAWQQFTVGHCDFFLVDMRSQRSDLKKALSSQMSAEGKLTWTFAEPPGHTMLGQEQLAWLLTGLKNSKALWKFVFMPVEINPRYDAVMYKAIHETPVGAVIEALGDSWCGYPTERDQILALHRTGQVKNIVFLTGDAHMGAMKARDADCPPIHMAANLDIGQAPIMDLIEKFAMPAKDLWPEWYQLGTDPNTIGVVKIVTQPKHQVICQSYDPDGALLHAMTIDLEAG